MKRILIAAVSSFALIAACGPPREPAPAAPPSHPQAASEAPGSPVKPADGATPAPRAVALASWNDTAAKRRILDFVAAATNPKHDGYVTPSDRVAVFDNDGTLWVEKPTYPQVEFVISGLRAKAEANADLAKREPYREALAGDRKYFSSRTLKQWIELILHAHEGLTDEEYIVEAKTFLQRRLHSEKRVPQVQLVYQPMVELMALLRGNGFEVFIVTGGDTDFVRSISSSIYDVPPQNVVGSNVQYEWTRTPKTTLRRLPELVQPFNAGKGKAINIQRHLGQRPVVAVGNSDGDVEMLQMATDAHPRGLAVLVHHDDADREYAYDDGAERALAAAKQSGWLAASMRDDFASVFSDRAP